MTAANILQIETIVLISSHIQIYSPVYTVIYNMSHKHKHIPKEASQFQNLKCKQAY